MPRNRNFLRKIKGWSAKKDCKATKIKVGLGQRRQLYTMDENIQGGNQPINLEELTGFQFGPAWARKGAESGAKIPTSFTREPKGERKPARRQGGSERPFNRDRRDNAGKPRDPKGRDRDRRREPQRELPQPAEGYRVELRPCNTILEVFTKEIQKQKRAHSLLDLARVVMAAKDRYDLVFMKQEGGSTLIHSTKGDGACWLTEAEAVAYMWDAPWFAELYTTEQIETEAPKGTFTAIATCTMGNEVIGPVNWHGYQAALMNLYRSKYANMPLDAFKSRITLNKDEEAVAAWLEQAKYKTVWKPTREGAADTTLEDARAVEADFLANAYTTVYETTDKVFINGATSRKVLSPGLAAHQAILSDKTRRSPQMLIPNLCHGLARHHMPIYKWQGKHFTGPSRVRTIPADTVLADRMVSIIEWCKANSGKKVEAMFAELSGVPGGTEEATEAHAPYTNDMIWLLEQGFIVVTADNSIWYPKGELAPAPAPAQQKRPQAKGKKKPAPKKADTKPAEPAAPVAEAPAAEEAPAPTTEEQA